MADESNSGQIPYKFGITWSTGHILKPTGQQTDSMEQTAQNQQLAQELARINTVVKRLRMRELFSELSFQLVQRLRKTISLGTFIKL